MSALHFIGVRDDEYLSAVRIWGVPDYTHERVTWSLLGSIPADDKVVFGPHAFTVPKKRRRTAHALAEAAPKVTR